MRMMIIGIAVAMLAGLAHGSGPLAPTSHVSFALKGGVNPSSQTLDPNPGWNEGRVLGFGGGATLGFNLSSAVSFDTDVLYVRKGTEFTGSEYDNEQGGTVDVSERIVADYVTVSPLIRTTFRPGGTSPYLLAGVEFGYLVKASDELSMNPGGSRGEKDVTDKTERTDFSLSFGGGMNFPTSGSSDFFLEARYYLGLKNTVKQTQEDIDANGAVDVKNRGTYVMGGFRF